MSNLEKFECEDLGVTTEAYQKRASRCLRLLVETHVPTIQLLPDVESDESPRIAVRVRKNPPQARIDKLPIGGPAAGKRRIQEISKPSTPASRDEAIKVMPFAGVPIVNPRSDITEAEMKRLFAPDRKIVKPEPIIVGVGSADLTCEYRLYTIGDIIFAKILALGIISPREYAEILAKIGQTRGELVVVIQRQLLGIEPEREIDIPYDIVPAKNEDVFEFIESVAA